MLIYILELFSDSHPEYEDDDSDVVPPPPAVSTPAAAVPQPTATEVPASKPALGGPVTFVADYGLGIGLLLMVSVLGAVIWQWRRYSYNPEGRGRYKNIA